MARQVKDECRSQLLHRGSRSRRHAASRLAQEGPLRADSRRKDALDGAGAEDAGDHPLPRGRLRQVRQPDGLL